MSSLSKKWAGNLYGTNTGKFFLKLEEVEGNVKGEVRIADDVFGLSVYSCNGTFDEELQLKCVPTSIPPEGIELGEVDVSATLTQDGRLEGEWASTLGTGGAFVAHPHGSPEPNVDAKSSIPEQVYNKNIQLGAIRLASSDLNGLISHLKRDFIEARVIASGTVRGSMVTKYADAFIASLDGESELNDLKLTIQEHEAHGIDKVIVVDLMETGINEVRASGTNESWVVGSATSTAELLRKNQKGLVTTYRKYGLNINSIFFVTMLVLLPEITDVFTRGLFVLIVLMLLGGLYFLHSKFIPNTVIYLSTQKQGVMKRVWPSVLSWGIAVSSSLVAAWIFYLLTRGTAS